MIPLKLAAALLGLGVLLVSLPSPAAETADVGRAAVRTAISVRVHRGGRITCDGQTLTLAQLQQRVNQLPKNVEVRVQADPDATFNAVAKVMATVAPQIGKMGFLLEPREESSK